MQEPLPLQVTPEQRLGGTEQYLAPSSLLEDEDEDVLVDVDEVVVVVVGTAGVVNPFKH
jgi:hypothetical protein